MTGFIDAERVLDAFLAPEHDQLADRVLEAALADIARTPQRRALRVPWRFPHVTPLTRVALVAAALVAVLGGGALFFAGGVGPGPTPSPTPVVTPAPTSAPFAYDPHTWTPAYTSSLYGYSTALPPGWHLDHAATRPFDPATDTVIDPRLRSIDTFVNEEGSVAVGMFEVPEGTGVEWNASRAEYERWAERLCQTIDDAPCAGVAGRSTLMCEGNLADCRTALIVPFDDDVFAYFKGNQVAVVWHGETAPEVAEYGGATNLLKQFLKTRNVYTPPSSTPAETPAPTPAPTQTPTPRPAPTEVPGALTYFKQTWTPYTSHVYGFTAGMPPGWLLDHAATRPFDPATDTVIDPRLRSIDTFVNEAGSVAVGMFEVPEGTGVDTSAESLEAYEALAERLCQTMNDAPCTGIADRSIPMCRERADCHPALVVPFDDDVFGYFLGNQVAVVWHADDAPEVAGYGGATNVLKAFLQSRNVHTPNPGQVPSGG